MLLDLVLTPHSNTEVDFLHSTSLSLTTMAPVEDNKWYTIHLYNEFHDDGAGDEVVDLDSGSSNNGTHCKVWTYKDDGGSGRYNMSWRAVIADKNMDDGTIYWSFQNRAGTTYMDLNHGSNGVGTQVQGWGTNGSNAQQWSLVETKGNDRQTVCWR